MGRFRKTILSVGTHKSPEGDVVVTPERLQRFAATHREMVKAGITHPVCWGHHLSSVPQYPKDLQFDAHQYLASAFNCGRFVDLIVNGEDLDAIIDVPGAEVDNDGNLLTWVKDPDSGNMLRTSIREVSPAVCDQFVDGRKKSWNDIVGHIALVPYPVQAGQTGFQALSLNRVEAHPGFSYITTGKATGWKMLATGDRAGKFSDGEADEEIDLEDEPEIEEVETDEPDLGGEGKGGGSEYAEVAAVVDQLAEVAGIHLPGATTKDDLLEHLKIVLQHMQSAKSMEPAEGAAGDTGQGAGPVVAEQAPMMMSAFRNDAVVTAIKTAFGADADKIITAGLQLGERAPHLGTVNTKLLSTETARRQRIQTKLLEKVAKRVPADILTELDIKPEMLMLSTTRAGDIVEPKAFSRTELLRIILATVKAMPNSDLTKTLSTGMVHENPLRAGAKKDQVSDEESWGFAERIAGRKRGDPLPNPERNGRAKKRRPADK